MQTTFRHGNTAEQQQHTCFLISLQLQQAKRACGADGQLISNRCMTRHKNDCQIPS